MKRKNIYFVSGIDTDAGKSYATGALAAMWMRDNVSVITQKFIQTGCPAGDMSEDILLHRRIMGTGLMAEDLDGTTCPVRLRYPASPDMSARLEGAKIDLSEIERCTQALASRYDTVLIEGAGGLMVPIKGEYTMIDYVADRGLPLILVTNPKLGSVNHTLLSLEACRTRGIDVDILLYNLYPETSPEITADTRDFLQGYLYRHHPACRFVEIPYITISQ